MANCSKCGANAIMKTGISSKNGKPWTGFKCQDQACGNMDFLKSNQNITPQITPAKSKISNEPEIIKMLLDILRKQDEIKAMISDIHPAKKLLPQKPSGEEAF